MKFVVYGIIAAASFAITTLAALALTGNLSAESLGQIIKSRAPAETVSSGPDPQGVLAEELKKKSDELRQREEDLAEREAQFAQREAALEEMRNELQALQQQIGGSLESAAADRATRNRTVAITVSGMRPANAAKALDGMLVEDVAAILAQVKEKDRGKILDSMEAERATRVLKALKEAPPATLQPAQ